jgi:hypothetical protein
MAQRTNQHHLEHRREERQTKDQTGVGHFFMKSD